MRDSRYAVVMAGGRGERFWPLSTVKRPKQVLSLVGGSPMLAQAVERLAGLIPAERIIIITSDALVDVTRKVIPGLPAANIIGEPCGRDTAAACALGAAIVQARCPGGAFCVLTADHVIKDTDRFQAVLQRGFEAAESGDTLVTLGIKPTFPATGFGYIECGDLREDREVQLYEAIRFVEKPDAQTAATYVASGRYLWNSGMFIWSVDSLLSALRQFAPDVFSMASRMVAVVDTPAFNLRLADEYNRLGRISIDYAVMEKASNIVTAAGGFAWYDVGSWPALEDHFEKDGDGNVFLGRGRVLESGGNIVVAEGRRVTALIGVDDLVVVHAGNATLICAKSRAQDVKQMVQLLAGDAGFSDVL